MPVEPDIPVNSVKMLAKNRSASGGINTFSSQLDIGDDQLVDLTNGIATVPGLRESRAGTAMVASGITHGPIMALSEFTPSTFVSELLAVTPGAAFPNAAHQKLWKWSGAGNWSLIGTLTGFTSATLPVDIVPFLDLNLPGGGGVCVRIQNKDSMTHGFLYAGGGITSCTGPNAQPATGMFPIGTALGRMFGAGRTSAGTSMNRCRLFYSDVASATVTGWASATQAFTMGGGTKQEIIALAEFRGFDLVVFMADRVEVLTLDGDPYQLGAVGSAAWSRGTIDRKIGCGSRRSVQTVGEDLFFVDQYANVRSLNRTITDNSQGTKSLPVSAQLKSWIERVNIAAIDTTQAAAYDRHYVVSFPIDSAVTPSHTFVYDIVNKAWYGPWTGTWATVGTLAVATLNGATIASDKGPTLYIGGSATAEGRVYRSFYGTTDDGAAIVYQETGRRESFGTIDSKKKPLRERVYTLPSAGMTTVIEMRRDGGDFKLVGYINMSGESPQLPLTGPIDFTGAGVVEKVLSIEQNFENARDLQLRLTCTATQTVQFLGHTTQVHMKNVDWTPN